MSRSADEIEPEIDIQQIYEDATQSVVLLTSEVHETAILCEQDLQEYLKTASKHMDDALKVHNEATAYLKKFVTQHSQKLDQTREGICENLRTLCSDLKAEVQRTQQHNAIDAESAKELLKVRTEYDNLQVIFNGLETKFQTTENVLETVKSARNQIQTQLQEEQKRVAEASTENAKLQEQVARLQEQVDSMRSNGGGEGASTGGLRSATPMEPYKDGVYTYFSKTCDSNVLCASKPLVVTDKTVPQLLNLFGFSETLQNQAKVQIKTAKDSKYSCAPFSTYENDKMMFCVYSTDHHADEATVHYIGKYRPPESAKATENKHPATFHGKL